MRPPNILLVMADQLHGFEERITTDIYPSDYAWTPNWELPNERIDKWYHNMDSVQQAGLAAGTFQIDYDDEVAFFAKRCLLNYARDQATPFCLVASFIHPHDPYVALKKWWALYRTESIDLPRHRWDYAEQDPFSQRLMAGMQAHEVSLSEAEIRRARHAYYANTSYVDDKLGQLIEVLRQTGQLDNTIVLFTADHGDMLGERGLWYKMNFFEHASRVPLVVAGPDIVPQQSNAPCSLVDLLPTLLDIAAMTGREKPELGQAIDGRSLLPLMQGQRDLAAAEAIGEYCAEMTEQPVLMIRRGDFKYILRSTFCGLGEKAK